MCSSVESGLESARLEARRAARRLMWTSGSDAGMKEGSGRREGDERTDLRDVCI